MKYVEERGNKIKVYTPKPYITYYIDEEHMDEELYKLEQDVKFLRECLKLLGISWKQAKTKDYTLNIMTGDKFRSLAYQKGLSNEMQKVMMEHRW